MGQRLSVRNELKSIGFDDVFSPLLEAKVDNQADIFLGDSPVPCKNDMFRGLAEGAQIEKLKVATNMRRSSVSVGRPTSMRAVQTSINNPINGIFSGKCIAVKNRSDTTAAFGTVFGSKPTKHRWYVISPDTGFSWFEGDKAPPHGMAPRGTISISTFVDIRSESSDAVLNKSTNFCFEVSIT